FQGIVRVTQRPRGASALVRESSVRYAVRLDLLPQTFRRMAQQLVGRHNQEQLLAWLGMDLRATPQGLQAVRVRRGLKWADLMSYYDQPPLDSKVDRKEFEQRE